MNPAALLRAMRGERAPSALLVPSPEKISDARGGFGTPAAPTLLPPGATDPRVRAFTKSVVDPRFANDPNWQALPAGEKENVIYRIPPPEDLDRVALFAPPAPGYTAFTWPGGTGTNVSDGGVWREGTWADIVKLGPDAVKAALAWWRQALLLGPLPEDDEYTEQDPRSATFDWPKNGTNRKREIYFWGYGKDGKLYKHLQVQKQDNFDNFKIFNQWGQNLTFVWRPDQGKWIAGFDAGDWFTQNKLKVAAGIQIVFAALVTALSLGTAAPGTALATAATVSATLTANQALQGVFTAIATGNFEQAFQAMIKMGTALADIPEVRDAMAKSQDLQDFVKSEPMRAISKITSGMKTPISLQDMVTRAAALAPQIPITPDLLKDARAQVPDQLQVWFDVAYQKGKSAVLEQASIPWYALGAWQFGATLGTLVDAKTYMQNVVSAGGTEKQYTVAQTLAMLKQQVQQGGNLTVRQVLDGAAGVKAPKHLPSASSRSPAPASQKNLIPAAAIAGAGALLLAVLFFL